MPKIGPLSRPGVLTVIDGRRAEARLMREVRDHLLRQLGLKGAADKPPALQDYLAARSAQAPAAA